MEYTAKAVVLLIFVPLVCIGLIVPKPETELYLIRVRIKLLTQRVHEKCPDLLDHGVLLGKRDLAEKHDHTMEMERELYRHVKELYENCYFNGLTTTTLTTTTTPTDRKSTRLNSSDLVIS